MHVGDHGAERELPFEAEPEIDEDRADREHEADRAVGEQLGGNARPDHLDAPILDILAERIANLLHRLLLRRVAAGLLGNADQHVVRRAELLELKIAEVQPSDRAAHLGKIGRSGFGLHLHEGAADKVDAEIQAVKEVQQDRRDRQHRRYREANAPKAHKVELGVVGNDAEEAHGAVHTLRG